MIKSFLFLSALLGVQTMPVHTDDQYVGQQERHYQHTEDIGGNTEVTYKYETNEVNSVDDLIVGNLYKIDLSTLPSYTSYSITDCYDFYGSRYTLDFQCNYLYTSEDYSTLNISAGNFYLDIFINNSKVNSYGLGPFVSYFQYKGNFNSRFIEYVSIADFNVIEDVVYNAPTSLFGLMADFFDQYIYSGIPHINDISYEINGTNITMKDWLVVSTTIAVVILFLFILFFIFRWLIRTFSNAFLWR